MDCFWCEIVSGKLVLKEYDYPTFHLSMDCFLCVVVDGEIILKEAEAARWLDKENLYSVEWLPADVSLIEKIAVKL